MAILAELRNRGVQDACIVACGGLKDLPWEIAEIWPAATVQLCVVHLVRANLRYASKKYWSQISKDLRPVYIVPTEASGSPAKSSPLVTLTSGEPVEPPQAGLPQPVSWFLRMPRMYLSLIPQP